jgi:superfamily II DNA or RNA helicase
MHERSKEDLEAALARLRSEYRRLQKENQALRQELGPAARQLEPAEDDVGQVNGVTNHSSVDQKIRLFRSLFRGRGDVFPVRWDNKKGREGYSPACGNEWHKTLCGKPKVKCGACPNSQFLPVTDQVIHDHLIGKQTIGVYPILEDESCWFLAIDFDKTSWRDDVRGLIDSCTHFDIPAYVERSRSGDGAHVWVFFSQSVQASLARKLGSLILTHATARRPGIGLESYDRLFPSQDTLPKGGFGNLIALPLQKQPRELGNSEFLTEAPKIVDDQWAFLDRVRRVSRNQIEHLVQQYDVGDNLLGVRRVSELEDELEDSWTRPELQHEPEPQAAGDMPESVRLVLSNGLRIPKHGMPPSLENTLIRLAAFQNPEFYRAQAMRMSTYGKPRIISCAEDLDQEIVLPRGCLDAARSALEGQGITVIVDDQRFEGDPIDTRFLGTMRPEQEAAANDLLDDDTGLLCAPTAFGKTVVAAAVIGERRRNTLILVHRRQLMEQWRERLATFLDRPVESIGQIGGGKRKRTGEIDIAVMQSINRKGKVDSLVGEYGQIIVDEAHHVSAFSFESVLKKVRAKYILGLTATPVRKDGHHPIILMQCGPIRHRVTPQKQRQLANVEYRLIPRSTEFRVSDEDDGIGIQALYGKLAQDDERNAQIFDDILQALDAGRTPLVLTERVGHAELLAEKLGRFAKNVVILRGGRSRKKAAEALDALAAVPEDQERLIIATGRYIGEGFDDARLDTLFLTMPISWKGTLQQYVGRLHRQYRGKQEVRVYDYVDQNLPVLCKMYERRLMGYRALGYDVSANVQLDESTRQIRWFDSAPGHHLMSGFSSR